MADDLFSGYNIGTPNPRNVGDEIFIAWIEGSDLERDCFEITWKEEIPGLYFHEYLEAENGARYVNFLHLYHTALIAYNFGMYRVVAIAASPEQLEARIELMRNHQWGSE